MRKKKLFFFLTILIVSLLFYWLGRKQTGAEEIRIDTRESKAEGGIIVEKVLTEQKETEMRKIALTFDDDVIIGLSQEISCKEAVSMI